MFCPKCSEEFAWNVMVCPTCDVETVDRLPGPPPEPDVELVRVLSIGDAGLIAIARSILDAENIPFLLKGDGLQDLFGMGRVTEYSYVVGPAEFWVRADDAERASELLADLQSQSDR